MKANTNNSSIIDPMEYLWLVKKIAQRISLRIPTNSMVSLGDLINVGFEGLLDAIKKFDESKGVLFKTYAEFRIRGSMLDELRYFDFVPRSTRIKEKQIQQAITKLTIDLEREPKDKEVALKLGISLKKYHSWLNETKNIHHLCFDELRREDMTCQITERSFSDNLAKKELFELLSRLIGNLPVREKRIVLLYYHEEMTMKEIGVVMGYTESRISQIHTKAILRLRKRVKK